MGFCLNYSGCCAQGTMMGSDCFCKHPLVNKCKESYDECVKNNMDVNVCKSKLKDCCVDYNKIDIDSKYFQKPVKMEQESKMLCSLTGASNIQQKCLELCQTNDKCKSYAVSNFNCMLFNDIDPSPTKSGITPMTDYYIKK